MAYNSNGSYLKNVTVPRQTTDSHSRTPSFKDSSSRAPPNPKGNVVHSHGGFLNYRHQISRSNHPSDSHEAIGGRQQFQGVVAPSPSINLSPGAANAYSARGEDCARSNNQVSSLDYQGLLLSLAEEYFDAAHSRESLDAVIRRETDMQTYYKLIATGLGCLEALLNVGHPWISWGAKRKNPEANSVQNWKLHPHREAVVRLRYATVLYEETNNSTQAEEALTKGVLCKSPRDPARC